jgi:hypothetical protein
MESVKYYCPELVAEYGDQLCCAPAQIPYLVQDFILPESVFSKCPACWNNYRQIFCAMTCSPKQHEFLRPEEIILNNEGQAMIKILNTYVEEAYVNGTYESCSGVKLKSEFPAMDLLCGAWGYCNCSPKTWFDYMGSDNGLTPFNINYKYVKPNEPIEDGITPFHYQTFGCSELVGGTRCSDMDCSKDFCPTVNLLDKIINTENRLEIN